MIMLVEAFFLAGLFSSSGSVTWETSIFGGASFLGASLTAGAFLGAGSLCVTGFL